MNQSHFLAVGKLMANHRADVKPRIPVAVVLLLLLLLLYLLNISPSLLLSLLLAVSFTTSSDERSCTAFWPGSDAVFSLLFSLNSSYGLLECDASDASDAPTNKVIQNRKTKAQEVGLPEIPCMFCGYKDPLEFDLSLHYLEKHRSNLIKLPIGKSSIDDRADYAELSKQKLFESLDEEDDGEADDDDLEDEDEGDE